MHSQLFRWGIFSKSYLLCVTSPQCHNPGIPWTWACSLPEDHTKNLTLMLEHLQLENQSLSVPLLFDGESVQQQKYQLNLPQGPLYSRVTIEAESRLRIKATKWLDQNTLGLGCHVSYHSLITGCH